ncbi:MAG: site-2 protease family protein [Candidatus Nanopelagicales bacterium]|nr:site-2 protease family protein [Candidatus Nanopelagicales bacterium]
MNEAIATTIGVIAFIALIFASIALHEFGHFATAKRFGLKITEFMIGFGPVLASRQKGETKYGVKAVPLGGYVRIVGMYPPERIGRRRSGRFSRLIDEARSESLKEIKPGDEGRVFYRLPVAKRLAIMLAGPLMNLVLAVILFSIVLVGVGLPVQTTSVAGVVPCVPTADDPRGEVGDDGSCPAGQATPASKAGLRAGDTIVSVGNQSIGSWEDLTRSLESSLGPTVVVVNRGGSNVSLTADLASVSYPVFDEQSRPTGDYRERTFLGVRPQAEYQGLAVTEVPSHIWGITRDSVVALGGLPARLYELGVTLATNGERDPGGPVSVVGVSRLSGEIAATDEPLRAKAASILGLAALLNLFLFLFNLLPLLPLDGGHVAAALWEAARRRLAAWRHRPDPGPVDTARLLPVTYVMAITLIGVGIMVVWADIVKPITLGG